MASSAAGICTSVHADNSSESLPHRCVALTRSITGLTLLQDPVAARVEQSLPTPFAITPFLHRFLVPLAAKNVNKAAFTAHRGVSPCAG